MARTEKKVIRGYVAENVHASDILGYRAVPAYDDAVVLRAKRNVVPAKNHYKLRSVRITIEVIDK